MIKNVFCSWLWTSNGEQVLEEKMNFNAKIERSTINAGFKYRQADLWISQVQNLQWPRWFSKNDFFLIIPQSNHVLSKEHVLGTIVLQIFFWAYMIAIMKNIVKELSALDYESHTPFRYLRGAPPVCKQNYKKYL